MDSLPTSRWPSMIQLCVMGSFRSSIQVSSGNLAPNMPHPVGPAVIIKKIGLRRLHRALSPLRSLFPAPRIVKQPALRFQVFLFFLYFRGPVLKAQNLGYVQLLSFALSHSLPLGVASLFSFTFRVLSSRRP